MSEEVQPLLRLVTVMVYVPPDVANARGWSVCPSKSPSSVVQATEASEEVDVVPINSSTGVSQVTVPGNPASAEKRMVSITTVIEIASVQSKLLVPG